MNRLAASAVADLMAAAEAVGDDRIFRFSTQMQRDASIEDQKRLCRERAGSEDWEVTATSADRALSGASMLQTLLEAAAAGAL